MKNQKITYLPKKPEQKIFITNINEMKYGNINNKNILFLFVATFLINACKKDDTGGLVRNEIGREWKIVGKIKNTNIFDIVFVDNLIGYAVADSVYKTDDGGINWKVIKLKNSYKGVGEISAFSENVYLIGEKLYTLKSDSIFREQNLDERLNDIKFINKDTGFLVGRKSLYKTVDGGANWKKVISINKQTGYSSLSIRSSTSGIVILDSIYYFNGITDQYYTLHKQPIISNSSVHFASDKVIYYTSESGLFRSRNLGQEFSQIIAFNDRYQLLSAFVDSHFFSESEGFVSAGNLIFKTTDGGNNWETTDTKKYLIEMFFLNPNLGWACSSDGTVFKYAK